MNIFIWAGLGYLAGSFPSAWFVGVATGRRLLLSDVQRTVAETDAHLVLKESRGRVGSIAAALDVFKGLIPVVIAVYVAGPYEIAACAVGAVTGHCWPPILYRYAGRGLATAAGVFLAFLPVEMAVAGVVRVIGFFTRTGGLLSTVGFVAIPVLAWLRGQPAPYVLTAVAINVLIFVRRLEGLETDVAAGVSLPRVLYRRVVFDASTRSDGRTAAPSDEGG